MSTAATKAVCADDYSSAQPEDITSELEEAIREHVAATATMKAARRAKRAVLKAILGDKTPEEK